MPTKTKSKSVMTRDNVMKILKDGKSVVIGAYKITRGFAPCGAEIISIYKDGYPSGRFSWDEDGSFYRYALPNILKEVA